MAWGPTVVSLFCLDWRSEFELIVALSKLLTTDVTTKEGFRPRVWLISSLGIDVDPLHLDQRSENSGLFLISC